MSRPLGGHRRTCLSKIPIFTLCSTATLFYFFRAEVWTQRGGIQLLAKRKSSFFHLFRQEGGTLDLGAAHRKDKSEKNVETTGQGPSSGKKRERHEASPEKSQKRSPESHRRHRRPGPGKSFKISQVHIVHQLCNVTRRQHCRSASRGPGPHYRVCQKRASLSSN